MRLILALIGILILLASSPLHAAVFDLTCTFSRTATVFLDDNRNVEIDVGEEKSWEIGFEDLDSDSPKIVRGFLHATPIEVIRKERGIVWLGESIEPGMVNFWTLFLKQKMAIFTQHRAIQPSGIQAPVGNMSMGKCR